MKKFTLLCLTLCLASALLAKEYQFTPAKIDDLKALLGSGKLAPGDVVSLEDGTYNNLKEIDFTGTGSAQAPIVLKAKNPGGAVISGALRMKIYGQYLQVEGLKFYKAWAITHDMIDFQKEKGVVASNCRFTNCVIDDCNDPAKGEKPGQGDEYWLGLRGSNNRVDHCYFANKRVGGLVLQVWLDASDHLNNHVIDHNVFCYRQLYGGNGAEIIRIGHSWSSQLESRTLVEENVFFQCNGENETISVKSCNNLIRKNLFYECQGQLTLRHGHNNIIESNVFIGNGVPNSGGIRIINQGHSVYDNYMQGLTGRGSNAALIIRMGVYEKPTAETDTKLEPLTSYHRAVNVNVSFNTIVNCKNIDFCSGGGDKEPRNVRFANNTIYNPDSEPIITVSKASAMDGIAFSNNVCDFKDGKLPNLSGFVSAKLSLDELVKGRNKAVSPSDCGAAWYAPVKETAAYIAKTLK